VRRWARLVGLVGAALVGWLLLGARPHDVVLVYDASSAPDATAIEVDLRSAAGALLRHARIQLHAGEQARHPLRLRDGRYALAWRLDRPSGTLTGERTIDVEGDETIVLPLGR
jgi:hypothetical protein